MKVTFFDLLNDAGSLVAKDSRFTIAGDNGCCCQPYVVDIILDGDKWSAIVQAANGKYYQVALNIGDNDNDGDADITGLGDFTEVERDTVWSPVNEAPFRVRMEIGRAHV